MIAGQPLSAHHAVLLYSVQVEQGVPVTPATAFGIIEAPNETSQSGIRPFWSLGDDHFILAKPGVAQQTVNTGNVTLQNSDFLLNCCVRTNKSLPWITIGIGYKDDAGTMWAKQIPDCKVGQMEITWDAGGADAAPIIGSFTIESIGVVTEIATLSPANLSDQPLDQFEGVVTRGGAAHECQSFRLSVNQNLRKVTPLYGTAPVTGKRLPKYLKEGREEISGQVVRYAKSGINMQADTIASSTLAVALTDIAGAGNTIGFSLATSYYTEEQIGLGEDILFTCPYIARTLTIS